MTTAQGTTLHEELTGLILGIILDERAPGNEERALTDILAAFHRNGWRPGADALIDRYQGKAVAANRALEPLQAENERLRKQITALTKSADRIERQVIASGIVYALQDLQAQIKASRKMLES